MKILGYIFLIAILLLIAVWFLLPFILRFSLNRFVKKMRDLEEEDQQNSQQDTIISSKKNTQAEQTDFEELN
jgi:uncharacterized membrane protein